VYSKPNLHWIV